MSSFEENSNARYTTEEVIKLLSSLLCDHKLVRKGDLEEACEQYPSLRDLVDVITNLRLITASFGKGDLEVEVPSQGYVISNLKALQSSLNHLVWQVVQVSKGDFSQRVDYLGDFSRAFNSMCEKLERHNLELTELAQLDGLTKLANRQHLDKFLCSLFSEESSGVDFALLMIDIDFFKNVNDTYGHDIGDMVLGSVAKYLRYVFRTADFIARYGGEEFVVILPSISLGQSAVIASRVLQYFREHPIVINDTLSILVTVSIGVTVREETDDSWEQIIKRSDIALYNAKNNGRDRVEYNITKIQLPKVSIKTTGTLVGN